MLQTIKSVSRRSLVAPALAVLLLAAAACSSGGAATATPSPTPTESAATADSPVESPAESSTETTQAGQEQEYDLSGLPDDPTALMTAALDNPLALVGRKMAYSRNRAFIPVLLEFMRFQTNDESVTSLASFMSRIKDNAPPDEVKAFPQEEREWDWWVEWLADNPEVRAPEGFTDWKGQVYSLLDPEMGAFLTGGVETAIRSEEIVWGGVVKDGIPDLRNPPAIPAEDADYLLPDDRVFGLSINGQHRAYPLRIMNPHEMANDVLGGVPFALAY